MSNRIMFKTQEEAAKRINRDVRTIRRWVQEGILTEEADGYDFEQLIKCCILKKHHDKNVVAIHLEMLDKINHFKAELEKLKTEFYQLVIRKKQKINKNI